MNSKPVRKSSLLSLLLSGLSFMALAGTESEQGTPLATSDKARKLTQDTILVDTHIDVPYRLKKKPDDISQSTKTGDFDLPRAKKGGLDVIFMSIYTPAKNEAEGTSKTLAEELIKLTEDLVKKSPDAFALATCTKDIYSLKKKGLISFAMGMENGSPLEGDMANADYFRIKGIRYITLAHSKSNHISDSSYDDNERWQGLSPFGKKLVPVLNARGIMIDISHLSDKAAEQVLELSKSPLIASHSSLRHFVPGFHRNMTDKMLKTLAEKGGVIQINFGSGFVAKAPRDWADRRKEASKRYKEENKLKDDDPLLKEFTENYSKTHPYPFANLSDVLDHFDRVTNLVGVDHVGIGSDYDGVGNTLPEGLKDVSTYPNLTQGLINRGYKTKDIQKILGGNLLRVWGQVEEYGESKGYLPLCSQS